MTLSVFIPYSLACERGKCGVLLSRSRLPLWLPVRWRSLCTPLCRSPVWKTWFLLCGLWNQSTKMFVSVCVYSKFRSVIEILTIEVSWLEKVHLQSHKSTWSILWLENYIHVCRKNVNKVHLQSFSMAFKKISNQLIWFLFQL